MLQNIGNIFIVGIKGVAMANLAVILKRMGKNVTGSDVAEEFITDELLKENDIKYTIDFSPTNLPHLTNLVIYSAAHAGTNNPQIIEAKKRGIKILSQAEILDELSKQFKTVIAVCGCHGKTTTSSLLAYALINLEARPSYMVGTPSFNNYSGADYTKSNEYFVVEADEYGVNPPFDKTPKFQLLHPTHILCTNIDFDHPDVYKNLDEIKKSFFNFFSMNVLINQSINTSMFFCADDENLMEVAKKFPRKSYLTYGFSKKADLQIINPKITNSGSSFDLIVNINDHSGNLDLVGKIQNLNRMIISLFGKKNISNAAGTILTLLNLGFAPEKIKDAIKNFTGAKRRFEKIYFKNEIYLFDDYAHHPKEIETTIKTARERFPQQRIVIIFQPHTYSRTQILLKDFAKSLSLADQTYILPIFPSAREQSNAFKISSTDIVENGDSNKLQAVNSINQLIKFLKQEINTGDIIFTMGAGDVYKLKDDIINIIKSK